MRDWDETELTLLEMAAERGGHSVKGRELRRLRCQETLRDVQKMGLMFVSREDLATLTSLRAGAQKTIRAVQQMWATSPDSHRFETVLEEAAVAVKNFMAIYFPENPPA